jgi:hypothetical protein
VTPTRSQAGSITLWLTVMVVALFAASGLVYDGGEALAAKGRAVAAAYGAARAGANALDPARLAEGASPSADPSAATAAARDFLVQAGLDPGTATISVANGTVAVGVRITQPTRLLGVVGVSSLTVIGHGSARPIYGLTGGTP